VQRVRGNLYTVYDGYQVAFLVTRTGVVVVDAPFTLGRNALRGIREITRKPITHVIYSHSHADHIGSASVYPRSATVVAQRDTAAALRAAKDPRRPVAELVFNRRLTCAPAASASTCATSARATPRATPSSGSPVSGPS
jgi:glyoxylase-like metal-dependent hydrolase (beta-lactamase superfamily II)